jgi:hypothetical protein
MIYYNNGKVPKAQWGTVTSSRTKAPEFLSDAEIAQYKDLYAKTIAAHGANSNLARHQKSIIDKATAAKSTRDWRATQVDPNFNHTKLFDVTKYQTPATQEPYQFGQGFTPYKPDPNNPNNKPAQNTTVTQPAATVTQPAKKVVDPGAGYYRDDKQRAADPTSIASGPKNAKEAIDTSPYKDYLSNLSIDEVSDIVKYGTKKGYNKDQIDGMMKVAVEQTELAEKYGYKDKIDGLAGINTRAARANRAKALNEKSLADAKASEKIVEEINGKVETTDNIEEAAAKPNTIYSPREINRAYRLDRRNDREARYDNRIAQRKADRLERQAMDPEDRREDRILDRQARRNTARNSRVNDRTQRREVRDQMMKESADFPAIDRFKSNIAEQSGKLRKGGIFYKR